MGIPESMRWAVVVTLILTACGGADDSRDAGSAVANSTAAGEANPAVVTEGVYQPVIDPAMFVSEIDNPYLPLTPGTTMRYVGTSDGERETEDFTVLDRTKEVLGVTTTVVRDRVWIGGQLAESTFDWFAQDAAGNVWYFGEASHDYENGKIVSTHGSWEAGVEGAQPGIVMPSNARVDQTYRQEYLKGEAEDLARVVSVDATATVPSGAFDGVILTEDWNPLEPKVREQKYYAEGVGMVLTRVVEGGEGVLRLVDVRMG